MFNRGFGGGFGGYGSGGSFSNQFGGNRFQSGFVGGPGGSNGVIGMNRGGFRGGFNASQRFGGPVGGGFMQQRGGLFGRGRGSYNPRGGSRGGSRTTSNAGNKDTGKKDVKQEDNKTEENETKKAEEEKKNGQSQKDVIELKPRPASMDFGGPVGKKANAKQTEGDLPVGAKPPWETKKKTENKQDQKVDKLGAPWEKKKNDDLAEKASNAPWEIKKADQNTVAPPWTKKPEPKEVPPWKQKEIKSEDVIDLSTPPWQEDEDKSIGPPPWLQQQRQKNDANVSQQPMKQQQPIKKEPLFDSRKRPYESSPQMPPSGPGCVVKVEPMGSKQPQIDTRATLDTFNSDLNLVISNDGYSAETLNKPMGFCFCWGGARATYGVIRGKVCFEVKVTKNLAVDFGDDHEEADPHVLRVGWSVDSHGFQLGEDQDSFGFGGTGKFSANCRFSNYGQTYGIGDVIMALLDLEAKPPNISFAKNGRWFGVAHRLGEWPQGVKEKALFPHVLSKNCAFEINFGQRSPWFKPPPDFVFIDEVPLHQRVRGMMPPTKVSDCEIIMIVGLPGAGKTTWGINMQKDHPDKRFNIIGTDTLIDKMKVNGLPRKNNYHGRWDVLIKKATECLNKLFAIGSKKCRNYILDQTNVYATARKRKMRNFEGFKRICAVLITPDAELERRAYQRTYVDGKFVPDEAVLEMKANFSLPHESEPHIDAMMWIELSREQSIPLIEKYNMEGQKNRPPRSKAFPHDNRSQSQDRRDNRDSSEGRMGHQRSYSDRGPQGDRGRSWERNQDRMPQRGGFDRNQSGFQGGPGNRDQGFPDKKAGRSDSDFGGKGGEPSEVKRQGQSDQGTWQKQPGNRQEWAHGGRVESPAGRREDIPFKKPKVETQDPGFRNNPDGRDQGWPPQAGHVKEERMEVGYEQARFSAGGNRYLADKDVDYRLPRGQDSGRPSAQINSPFDRDDRNQGVNRYGNSAESSGKDDRSFQGNQFGASRGENRFGPPHGNKFARDQRDFSRPERFQQEGPSNQFRTPEGSFNQPIKLENPFKQTGDNPFLARLAEFDKVRPLRFDQYVKNTARSEDDLSKGFGFRRGGNYSGGPGNRYGQGGRGGDNRFGGDKKIGYNADRDNRTKLSTGCYENLLKCDIEGHSSTSQVTENVTTRMEEKEITCVDNAPTENNVIPVSTKEKMTLRQKELVIEARVTALQGKEKAPKIFENFSKFFRTMFDIVWERRKRENSIRLLKKQVKTSGEWLNISRESRECKVYVVEKGTKVTDVKKEAAFHGTGDSLDEDSSVRSKEDLSNVQVNIKKKLSAMKKHKNKKLKTVKTKSERKVAASEESEGTTSKGKRKGRKSKKRKAKEKERELMMTIKSRKQNSNKEKKRKKNKQGDEAKNGNIEALDNSLGASKKKKKTVSDGENSSRIQTDRTPEAENESYPLNMDTGENSNKRKNEEINVKVSTSERDENEESCSIEFGEALKKEKVANKKKRRRKKSAKRPVTEGRRQKIQTAASSDEGQQDDHTTIPESDKEAHDDKGDVEGKDEMSSQLDYSGPSVHDQPGNLGDELNNEEPMKIKSKMKDKDTQIETKEDSGSIEANVVTEDNNKQCSPPYNKRRHSVSLATPQSNKKRRFTHEKTPLTTPVSRFSWQPHFQKCAVCKTADHGTNDPSCPAFTDNPSKRICFKGSLCLMSNMYPCKVVYCGKQFKSTEQAYQWKRAHDIGNPEVANKILNAIDGFTAKRFSKDLDRGKVTEWKENNSIRVMKDLIREKYKQVEEFRLACIESKNAFLIEATWDTFWGVGLLEEAVKNCKLEFLPGKNVLGWIIMQVRNEYLEGMSAQLRDLYNVKDQGGRSTFIQGIGHVFGERGNFCQGIRRQLSFSLGPATSKSSQNISSTKTTHVTSSPSLFHTHLRFPSPNADNFPRITSEEMEYGADYRSVIGRDNIVVLFSSESMSTPMMSTPFLHHFVPPILRPKSVLLPDIHQDFSSRTHGDGTSRSSLSAALSDLMSPRRNNVFTFPCNSKSPTAIHCESGEESDCYLSVKLSAKKCDSFVNEKEDSKDKNRNYLCIHDTVETQALDMVRGYTSSSDEQVDSDDPDERDSFLMGDELPPNLVSVGFGGNNRNQPFLARGPGDFNRDRHDTPRDGSSSRSGFDRNTARRGEEDGRHNKSSDDRDKYRDRSLDERDRSFDRTGQEQHRDQAHYDAHYNRNHCSDYARGGRRYDDDRREHDKKPESREPRRQGPGEEWSGGGDSGEWQGGGGDMPSHMRKLNDPRESGDDNRGAQKEASRDGGEKDQRRDTTQHKKEENWNQGQERFGGQDTISTKDVDYRQHGEQWNVQETRVTRDQRGEAENYAARGWNQAGGQQDQKKQTASHEHDRSKTDQYQQGQWNDPGKPGWQGGSSGKTDKRWENQGNREEWSGGWGNTGGQQQTAGHPPPAEDGDRWNTNQYGSEYQQQYSYPAGYEEPREQQYDSYTASNKASDKDQQAYSQQTHDQTSNQEWNQYDQQRWDSYGQSGGYGDWNQQQAATTESAESQPAKVGSTPTSSSQTQYSSWSEYKAASSSNCTEPTGSETTTQNANNPYGHYSQTSTTVNSNKNETHQTWDSGNYGYGAPVQQSSADTYAHNTQNSSGATASPQITQASILGAAANISLPPNLDLNAIQQSLVAHGFTQPPPPPPPGPAPGGVLFPAVAAYQAGQGLAGYAPGMPHGAPMYPGVRRQ